MKTASVIPVFLSWALGTSERSFPTVYKFHTGEWPFDIDFPTPSLQPSDLSQSHEGGLGQETKTEEVQSAKDRSENYVFFTTNFQEGQNNFPESQTDSSEDVSEYLIKEGRQILDFTTPSRTKLVRNEDNELENGALARQKDKRSGSTVNGWIVNDPSGTNEDNSEDPVWVVTSNSVSQNDREIETQVIDDESGWVVQDSPQIGEENKDLVWTPKDPSQDNDNGNPYGDIQNVEENSNVLPDSWTVQDTEPFTIEDARDPAFTTDSVKNDDTSEYSTDPESPLDSVTWVEDGNNGWEEVGSNTVEPNEYSVTPARPKPNQKRPRGPRARRKPPLLKSYLNWRLGPRTRKPSFFQEWLENRSFLQAWLDDRLGISHPRERQTIRLRRPSRPYRGRHFQSPHHHHGSHISHSSRPQRGAANVRFRRPIRQISNNNVFDQLRLRLQPSIGKRRGSLSSRHHSRKNSRFRNKYARKGPMLKKFRPPRHIKIRPSVAPKLHYQKYKEDLKSLKNQRSKSLWWRKPSNILKRSRLRNISGLKEKNDD